jgi:drug/metabolite transporter (DMT)-like permease
MTRRGWILFIVLGLLWGMPYLLIRIAVGTIDPLVVAGSRTLIGALLLLPVALHRNALGAAFRNWKWLLAFTVIEMSVPWVLLGHAETRLTSSTAGLLIAIVPLFAAVIVSRLGHERLDSRRLLGLGVGFAGVALLVGPPTFTSPTCRPCLRPLSSRCATPSGPSSLTASSRTCPRSV